MTVDSILLDVVKDAQEMGIEIIEDDALPYPLVGLSLSVPEGDFIVLHPQDSRIRAREIIAHELGHFHTGLVDLLEYRQWAGYCEHRAALHCVKQLMPLRSILQAYECGARGIEDFAEWLDVTYNFFCDGLALYQQKYGLQVRLDGYILSFSPLNIMVEGEEP